MARTFVYAFEGITDDLSRPPMAALRALLSNGVVVSARGWQELAVETREKIARVGAEDRIDDKAMSRLVALVPMSQIKLIGKTVDPSSETVPTDVTAALGPLRPLTLADWQGLRALDRYVLVGLAKNARLLLRAIAEMFPEAPATWRPTSDWSGAVAHAELRLRPEVFQQLQTPEFLNGGALVMSTVAGRRAARRLPELLDEHAESTVGPVEIDWGIRADDCVVFWQSHASTWEGAFFPAAALIAASSAAVALYDAVKGLDPTATLGNIGIREEAWVAGRDEQFEPSTSLYARPKLSSLGPASFRDTIRTDPEEILLSRPHADGGASPLQTIRAPLSSSPVLVAPMPSSRRRRAAAVQTNGRIVAVLALIGFINFVVVVGIVVFLVNSRR